MTGSFWLLLESNSRSQNNSLNRTRLKILHYAGKPMSHRLILLFLPREHLDLALEIVFLKPTSTKKLLDLWPIQQQLLTGTYCL